ncbi:MAG TPA: DUF6600 domain-containing protein, partial [Vicinamibacteria bacterium]|nr:DUF6600 domain-containing protein [Vicinamibacteria bacterium]
MARLSYVEGAVSFRPGGVEEWGPAPRNRPLSVGDGIWTDRGGRCELQLGTMTVRLAPETDFAFLNLDDDVTQLQLTRGTARVDLSRLGEGEAVEIDTPNAALSLHQPGVYRVDVQENGDSRLTVRRGDATATAEGWEVPVYEHETGVMVGVREPQYDVQDEGAPDDWERWCADRDRGYESHVSARYVSPDVPGWQDLDTYGRWQPMPGYGMVWMPSEVAPGWAPYRVGHWGYVAPWGWTWIDDAPWGFAPFHYGRWAYGAGAWFWVPGRVVARPVYAPALVAFVGGGGWSVSLSLGGGGVAWFPLGPREVYYPAYAVSPAYVRNVNVTNVNVTHINVTNVNVTNVTYVNQSVPGAVTAVPRAAFVSAHPVATAAVAVPPATAATLRASAGPVGVQPTLQSVLSRPQPAVATNVPRPPAAIASRPVVARLTPPPPPSLTGVSATHTAAAAVPHIKPAIPPGGPSAVTLKPLRPGLATTRPVAAASPVLHGGAAHHGPLTGPEGAHQGATGTQSNAPLHPTAHPDNEPVYAPHPSTASGTEHHRVDGAGGSSTGSATGAGTGSSTGGDKTHGGGAEHHVEHQQEHQAHQGEHQAQGSEHHQQEGEHHPTAETRHPEHAAPHPTPTPAPHPHPTPTPHPHPTPTPT